MLKEIHIAGAATYTDAQSMTGLKPVTFIFGTNGSGKTTISRIIANPTAAPTSRLVWLNDRPLECLVYNRDFAERNFGSGPLPGIFTLGEAEAETLDLLHKTRKEISKLETDIDKLSEALGSSNPQSGQLGTRRALRVAFEADCWKIKGQHDPHFKGAFDGLRKSKEKFCDRVLSELKSNTAGVKSIDDLKKRALAVFAEGIDRRAFLPSVSADDLIALERAPILAKKIVGKDDIDVAALVKRLGNSDWVSQGLTYINQAGDPCPFCQQAVDAERLTKLNKYFDETYVNDLAAIDHVRDAHRTYSELLVARLREIQASGHTSLDANAFGQLVSRLADRIELNGRQLDRKRKEASTPISLEGLTSLMVPILGAIAKANDNVATHNAIVDNLAAEKTALISEVWRCLLDESSALIKAFTDSTNNVQKAIAGLSASIEAKRSLLAAERAKLVELERSVTSVQPTVNEINAILTSFGFTSFKLATMGEHHHLYKIIRGDGADASATLSEGERSFITFLYFYHLLGGSMASSGITTDRLVVFDHSVSSLDSDVLFIVSTLMKRVTAQAVKGNGRLKQVIVLTHNIYFHRQVSFDTKCRGNGCMPHETFWIVRKKDERSIVIGYPHNPIKTSYELLWREVRNPDRSSLTIQNTLRRIIEHYFKILGNIDTDAIIARFQGQDQQVCGSLFTWVNDGSHSAQDDIYITADEAAVERYLDVFRRVFEVTKHEAHYEMMMGPPAAQPGGALGMA